MRNTLLALLTAAICAVGLFTAAPASAAPPPPPAAASTTIVLDNGDGGLPATPAVTARNAGLGGWYISFGRGIYLSTTGYTMKMTGAALVAAGGLIYVSSCAAGRGIPKIGYIVAWICNAIGVTHLQDLFAMIKAVFRDPHLVNSYCYQTRTLPSDHRWVHVANSQCSVTG